MHTHTHTHTRHVKNHLKFAEKLGESVDNDREWMDVEQKDQHNATRL